MNQTLLNLLASVRSRLGMQALISDVIRGAMTAGITGVALGLFRLLFGIPVAPGLVFAVIVSAVLVSAAVSLLRRRSWQEAATAIDQHYRLKDRTVTALEFSVSNENRDEAIQNLQMFDTINHLKDVDSRSVVPLTPPRYWGWSVVSIVAAVGLMICSPVTEPQVQADLVAREGTLQAAREIEKELEALEEFTEEIDDDQLRELVSQLRIDFKELEQPDAETREVLEAISKMQRRMKEMVASINVDAMDAQLQDFAEAVSGAEAFRDTSEALQDEAFGRAAEELENLSAEDMPRTESRPTSEKLAESAKAAREKGLRELGESLEELSEAIGAGNESEVQKAARDVAAKIRQHQVSRDVAKLLAVKSDQLSECKSMCTQGTQNSPADGQQGANSLAKGRTTRQSAMESNSVGAKSAGNVNGEKAQRQGQLEIARLTGQLTEAGESEFETETSVEGTQQAQRKARETFAEYQKMSEAVLESEPIPIGHRQTIRRYFERIRPTTDRSPE